MSTATCDPQQKQESALRSLVSRSESLKERAINVCSGVRNVVDEMVGQEPPSTDQGEPSTVGPSVVIARQIEENLATISRRLSEIERAIRRL